MGNAGSDSQKNLPSTETYFEDFKSLLNRVSPSFCIAKWSRVTLYLQHGSTHSCYHPAPHPVPLEELRESPAALHNTKYKLLQRQKMLKGERPSECSYCWNIEDLGETSDRVFKSSSGASINMMEEIFQNPLSAVIKPRYLEVSFSSKCQLKCSYCSPGLSSSWQEEINKFGAYPNLPEQNKMTVLDEKSNPYVKAFWKWWPELKKDLHTFRITGGEPLLSPDTFHVFEQLLQQPEPNLKLGLNSNLSVPSVIFQKFNQLTKQLNDQKAIKSFELFASIDSFGPQTEYIRHGLDHEKYWSNIEEFLSLNNTSKVTVLCTFGALSLFSFIPLLKKILELNLKHKNENRIHPIYLEISYLQDPAFQSLKILPSSFLKYMDAIEEFLELQTKADATGFMGFANSQRLKIKAIHEWMKKDIELEKKQNLQKQFYLFFTEHDKRRNTDLLKNFPELAEFWLHCKTLAERS